MWRAFEAGGDGVGTFQRGDDAFEFGELHERGECLLVRRVAVVHAALVAQPRVLGADPRIVESCRHRVRRMHLSIGVLQQIAQRPVQDPGGPRRERCRVLPRREPMPCGLDPDEFARICKLGA